MWEEASKLTLFGVEIYTWGLFCAVGALLAFLFVQFALRSRTVRAVTPACAGFLSVVFAMLGSRVLFCLLDRGLGQSVPFYAWFSGLNGGGWSVMGALFGILLAGFVTSILTGERAGTILDILCPAFLLFVVAERLGEFWIPGFNISRQLSGDTSVFAGTILAVAGEYEGIFYLRAYLVQALLCLILFAILVMDLKNRSTDHSGKTFLLFLILFGAVQTFCESLRYDYHISISFVGLQEIIAVLLLSAGVATLAVRQWKKQHRTALAAVLSLPVAAGVVLLIEFGLDRTTISHFLQYFVFIAALAVPVALSLHLRKDA